MNSFDQSQKREIKVVIKPAQTIDLKYNGHRELTSSNTPVKVKAISQNIDIVID